MKPICFTYENDAGDEVEGRLPTQWVICDNCRGNGKHVNPAVDGHGLSREDFDEDPDFEEAYFSGRYDVNCEECGGAGKVLVPEDEERLNEAGKKLLAIYNNQQAELARDRRADAHTYWMESGCPR